LSNEAAEEEAVDILIYQVSQGPNKLELEEIHGSAPFSYELLSTASSSFILDCTTDLFVYQGSSCPSSVRKGALQCAKLFHEQYDRPPWAKVWTLRRHHEHPYFQQLFQDFPEVIVSPYVGKIYSFAADIYPNVSKFFDELSESELQKKEVKEVWQDPERSFETWCVKSNTFKKLPPNDRGVLYRKECVLTMVTCPGDAGK
jgi:hypothetical protein